MTLLGLDAIRSRLGKHISIKIGMPGLFGMNSLSSTPPQDNKPPKISQFAALAGMFNGIK